MQAERRRRLARLGVSQQGLIGREVSNGLKQGLHRLVDRRTVELIHGHIQPLDHELQRGVGGVVEDIGQDADLVFREVLQMRL